MKSDQIYTPKLRISNCNIFTNSYREAFLLEKCEIVILYFNIEANFELNCTNCNIIFLKN